MTTATRLTLDEFLALPETEPPSEFICGEVVEKPMPTGFHSLLVAFLSGLFFAYLRTHPGEALVLVEPRHAHRGERRAYLPDVEVISRRRRLSTQDLKRGPLEFPPDIAIEVLSPDDRPSRVAEKLAFYLRAGIPLVWIVDPEERTIAAHRPGQPSTLHREGDVIDAAPVLSEFALDVGELFAALDDAVGQDN